MNGKKIVKGSIKTLNDCKHINGVIPHVCIRWLLLMLSLTLVLFFASCTKKVDIDLNDYVRIDFYGYETKGHAEVVFDKDCFVERFSNELEITDMDARINDLKKSLGNEASAAELFLHCITWSLDKSNDLSTNDEIQLSWRIDKTILEKEFNCRLKYDDKIFKVENLSPTEKYDPFKYVGVGIEGISPHASLCISYMSNVEDSVGLLEGIEYQLNKYNDVRNGEIVTVYVTTKTGESVEDYLIDKYGLMPTRTMKECEIGGLPFYVESIDDLGDASKDIYDIIEDDLGKDFSIQYAQSYYSGYSNKPDDIKCYLYLNKDKFWIKSDSDALFPGNTIYIGYKGDIEVTFPGMNTTGDSFGVIICVKNVIKYPNGEVTWDAMYYDTYEHRLDGDVVFYGPTDSTNYTQPRVTLFSNAMCMLKNSHYDNFWNGGESTRRGYDLSQPLDSKGKEWSKDTDTHYVSPDFLPYPEWYVNGVVIYRNDILTWGSENFTSADGITGPFIQAYYYFQWGEINECREYYLATKEQAQKYCYDRIGDEGRNNCHFSFSAEWFLKRWLSLYTTAENKEKYALSSVIKRLDNWLVIVFNHAHF